jgi:acetyltransferase-like isoleucine patch superfamily enzyme
MEMLDEKSKRASAQKTLLDKKGGMFSKYKTIFTGKLSLFSFIKYEFITMFINPLPGALGLFLRKIFLKGLFKKTGKGVIFGKNITIRHPKKIEIGDNVIFDDNCVIDAKGEENKGIKINNNVFIGRNTILSCKEGDIEVGKYSNIGANCYLISETKLYLGKYVFIAGNSYMVAGGNHSYEDKNTPMMFQPSKSKGGIIIEDDVWIGASCTIIDGIKIERGSIIGASSLVNKDIPSYSIAVGIPAKVIKKR